MLFLTQADMETQTVLEVEDWTSHALCTSSCLQDKSTMVIFFYLLAPAHPQVG